MVTSGKDTVVVPPSPTLRVRTMESDLEFLGKSSVGGNMQVRSGIAVSVPVNEKPLLSRKQHKGLVITLLILGFLVVFGAVGYFVIYPIVQNAARSVGATAPQ